LLGQAGLVGYVLYSFYATIAICATQLFARSIAPKSVSFAHWRGLGSVDDLLNDKKAEA